MHARGPEIKSPCGIFFLQLYGVPMFPGSNPSKKSQIFNTFQHTCHAPRGAFMASLNNPRGVGERRKATEIGLKCKTNSKNALLLHRKNEKFIFFKTPSFKFKNLLVPYCPHVWLWKTSLRSLLIFFPIEIPWMNMVISLSKGLNVFSGLT